MNVTKYIYSKLLFDVNMLAFVFEGVLFLVYTV